MIFQYFCKIFVPRSEGLPLSTIVLNVAFKPRKESQNSAISKLVLVNDIFLSDSIDQRSDCTFCAV